MAWWALARQGSTSSPVCLMPDPRKGHLEKFAFDLRELGLGKVGVSWIAAQPDTEVSRPALYAALCGTRLPYTGDSQWPAGWGVVSGKRAGLRRLSSAARRGAPDRQPRAVRRQRVAQLRLRSRPLRLALVEHPRSVAGGPGAYGPPLIGRVKTLRGRAERTWRKGA